MKVVALVCTLVGTVENTLEVVVDFITSVVTVSDVVAVGFLLVGDGDSVIAGEGKTRI